MSSSSPLRSQSASHPCSLIAATAQVAGCTYLLTEDLQDDLMLGTVRVVNPFRVSPETLKGR